MIAAADTLHIIPVARWRSGLGRLMLYALGAVAALAIIEAALLQRLQPTGAVFPNTNNLAAAMLPAIALALHYRKRVWASLFLIVLLLTVSRASIAALIVFGLVYYSRRKLSGKMLMAGIPLLVGGMALKSLMPNAGGLDQRLDLWRVALLMFSQNPLLGAGWFSFERYYQQLGSVTEMHGFHAHSLYLQIAAENGLAGLSSLGIGGLWTLRSMRKHSSRIGAALLIALAVHGLMDYPYWYIPNLLIVVIVLWVCGQRAGIDEALRDK